TEGYQAMKVFEPVERILELILRRAVLFLFAGLLYALSSQLAVGQTDSTSGRSAIANKQSQSVEQWGVFELELKGPADGNPFVDVNLSARFSPVGKNSAALAADGAAKPAEVRGFYDGDGVYRVRFMPSEQGAWKYITHSNLAELDGQQG